MATAPNPWNVNVTMATKVTFVINQNAEKDAIKLLGGVTNQENAGAKSVGKVPIVRPVWLILDAKMVFVTNHGNVFALVAIQECFVTIMVNKPPHLTQTNPKPLQITQAIHKVLECYCSMCSSSKIKLITFIFYELKMLHKPIWT